MTAGPGYPSTPVVVFSGALTTINPPSITTTAGGAVPADLRWVVITNSSPYTLLLSHGSVLSELAAFTADKFVVDQGLDAVPITLLPQPPQTSGGVGAAILALQDQHAYAVWYEDDPGGIYPAAIGAGDINFIPNSQLFNNPTVGNGNTSVGPLDVSGFTSITLAFLDQSAQPILGWTIETPQSFGKVMTG